ncbi:MAG: hypothetical protein EBT18_11365, partial [Gammaproteobacteria bacterium]|nr:hypothetical protein [Gammaproteobacteria bacterium]
FSYDSLASAWIQVGSDIRSRLASTPWAAWASRRTASRCCWVTMRASRPGWHPCWIKRIESAAIRTDSQTCAARLSVSNRAVAGGVVGVNFHHAVRGFADPVGQLAHQPDPFLAQQIHPALQTDLDRIRAFPLLPAGLDVGGAIYDVRLQIYIWKFIIKFLNNSINQLGPFCFYAIGGWLVIQGDLETMIECDEIVSEHRSVRDSGGHEEIRPFITIPVTLGPHTWEIEASLTNRDNMKFRMLLGRAAIKNRFVVDSSSSYRMRTDRIE